MPPFELRNHTPHSVTVVLVDGRRVDIPATDPPARCEVDRATSGTLETTVGVVPLNVTRRRQRVVDLPPRTPGVLLIVASAVAAACPERDDLVFPDEQARDEAGLVIECHALGRPG
ncbi:hypothetical protein SAMN05216377_12345 [Pseudonocardia oroxyli]|uniref:Uncharacterized protein n=1 Tax=Pseudonocardia oroxyli TaxID=366584 RepID=A0A1G8CSQ1_PSEOR|nr:hypothetical protein SAMN05216377_12345 [Pseudonocardia oroxyli]